MADAQEGTGGLRSAWLLRPAGLFLLTIAWRAGHLLVAVGTYHGNREPALIYLLALLSFACGSAGAALALFGWHLFDRVIVVRRWLP